MVGGQFIKSYLQNNWQTGRTGRNVDVPQPVFILEKDEVQERIRTNDVAHIVDGGTQDIKPVGIGWNSNRIETRMKIDLRTAKKTGSDVDGRIRMFGERDNSNVAESYGGLVGEIFKLMLEIRKGTKEYDLVVPPLIDDISGMAPKNMYRAIVSVRLKQLASLI